MLMMMSFIGDYFLIIWDRFYVVIVINIVVVLIFLVLLFVYCQIHTQTS